VRNPLHDVTRRRALVLAGGAAAVLTIGGAAAAFNVGLLSRDAPGAFDPEPVATVPSVTVPDTGPGEPSIVYEDVYETAPGAGTIASVPPAQSAPPAAPGTDLNQPGMADGTTSDDLGHRDDPDELDDHPEDDEPEEQEREDEPDEHDDDEWDD
jgi:hypothetical protein